MSSIRASVARVAGVLRRRSLDERLDDEVVFHVELLASEFEQRGLTPDEARAAAVRQFWRGDPDERDVS